MSLLTSTRSSTLPVDPSAAWGVVAAGGTGRHWYVDAAPLLFRAGLDRLLGGPELSAPPDRDLLRTGDRAGFWQVTHAEGTRDGFVLDLEARVRAPGTITMLSTVSRVSGGCRLTQSVTFRPSGIVGAAYLLADLPAREALVTLVHRRTCADVRAG
ncbi:MAG: DUF2867 domain-containing protein [Marmoricola sp.]